MRPIRVLIGSLGPDDHGLGAAAMARALRDAGMEVVYLGRFELPAEILKAAVEEGVDVIGLSCHSWESFDDLEPLLSSLREQERSVPVVVGGSVVTPAEAQAIQAKGVAAAFGPAAETSEVVAAVARLARES